MCGKLNWLCPLLFERTIIYYYRIALYSVRSCCIIMIVQCLLYTAHMALKNQITKSVHMHANEIELNRKYFS